MSICFHSPVERSTHVVHAKKLGPVTRSTGQTCTSEHFVWKKLDLIDVSVETGTQLCLLPVADLLLSAFRDKHNADVFRRSQLPYRPDGSFLNKGSEDVCLIKVYWDSVDDAYCAVARSWLVGLYKYFCNA
ncbi:hypothetical protein MRX96_024061 [Rhipicephalus microplus]